MEWEKALMASYLPPNPLNPSTFLTSVTLIKESAFDHTVDTFIQIREQMNYLEKLKTN